MQKNLESYYNYLTCYEISTAEEISTESDAAEYLLYEFKRRSPVELLERYISEAVNGYKQSEFNRLFNSDNIRRWKAGKPISRDKAYELAVYFGLDLMEAERFVRKYCMCDWLYLRSYVDSVYYFFLRHKDKLRLDGSTALETCRRIISDFSAEYEEYIYGANAFDEDALSANRLKRLRFEARLNPEINDDRPITDRCRSELDTCSSLDELKTYLKKNIRCFGEFNRKAYDIFMNELEYNKQLFYDKYGKKKPTSLIVDQISIDIEKGIPPQVANSNEYTELLRILQTNNPDRQGLEATINQKKPVTRKQLVLLFLLNENESKHVSDDFKCEEDEIEERRMRINMMLYECGMPLLDGYQPFDWLVLNELAAISRNESERSDKSLLSGDFFELLLSEIKKGNKNDG